MLVSVRIADKAAPTAIEEHRAIGLTIGGACIAIFRSRGTVA